MNTETKKMILVSVLCGLGYMMYSVDRMTVSSAIGLISQDFGLEKGSSGILLSSFFYGFIGFLFISGIIADKLSGKPVLILGLMIFSLATIFTGLAGSLSALIFYRVMTGIGEGIFWPAASLEVANVTTEKQRTTVMSLYWMGYPIGGFLGTWLGAMLGPVYGWRVVFYVAGAMGVVVAILYAILVKNEPKPAEAKTKVVKEKVPLRLLFTTPSVILMALYYFVLLCGWWIVLLWAPTFLMNAKQMPIGMAGTIASLLGLTGALGGFLLGRYCDRGNFNRKRWVLISITLLSGVLMAALVADLPIPAVVVLVMLLGFIGYPITPLVLAFTSELVPASIRGAAIGFVMNVGMTAGGISPVLAGYLAERYTLSPVWLFSACLMASSSLLLLRVRKVEVTIDEPVVSGELTKASQ
ncbi:MFS transporter [Yersinia alsatica]|uniref:MFS transporter n=2 Tax=Yersinia alsatica TaxID=2890317 RepID=A0ABY5UUZ6_9GAMM|nr:MFS transporter [Yersinia alsatica]OWF70120.1 MFS transporter [Yersinia frederiksenii]OWF76793.1 MFS transporter [Yersinia frederiksenii]UWM47154.1 MFS transporter [Yersinia alsatica]CFQ45323.1 sugar transporter [Yersinia frederiksenii]CNB91059.1 sugar transporter [Yersinia frederiksenii]